MDINEKTILKLVSEASSIPEDVIKGKRKTDEIAKARGAYLYLCKKYNVDIRKSCEYINRVKGSFYYSLHKNQDENIIKEVEERMTTKEAIWQEAGNETYIIVNGNRYSILDVSSCFGSLFSVFVNDVYCFSRKTRLEAVNALTKYLKTAN